MRRIVLFYISLSLILTLFGIGITDRTLGESVDTAKVFDDRVYLLVGVDKASYNADVMMLVRLYEGGLSVLQIPRDSLTSEGKRLNTVFAAACLRAKRRGADDKEAFSEGGTLLAEQLGEVFGVRVAAHATLTLSAFSKLIDTVGGVDVTLERALSYHDPEQGLTISLPAGEQHLDGAAAEGLVRCRNAYPDADYGRMRAQRKLIASLFHKLKHEFSPLALVSLFRAAYGEVETDLAFKDALVLLRELSSSDGSLAFATLVGRTVKVGKAPLEALAEKNLTKAADYLGGKLNEDAARRMFLYPSSEAGKIYEESSPPPFTVSE
ncbi:MAG: LCP family protein [Clostridia bacterium]|nr:LCP family protein [Clostridia bacterium]